MPETCTRRPIGWLPDGCRITTVFYGPRYAIVVVGRRLAAPGVGFIAKGQRVRVHAPPNLPLAVSRRVDRVIAMLRRWRYKPTRVRA